MRHLTALVLITAALPGLAAAQSKKAPKKGGKAAAVAPPAPKVSLVGYRVVGPALGGEDDQVRPFNWSAGVTVVVGVRVAAPYGLVALDKERSTVTLTGSDGTALEQPEIDWSPDFTKDRSTAMVELEAKGIPGEGSTHVETKGTLLFTLATGVKTLKVPSLKAETGTAFKLGTAPVTVGEVSDGYGQGPIVEFKGSKGALSIIKAVRAKDAKGAAVEVNLSSTSGFNDEWTVGYTFKTPNKGGVFNMEFDVWDGLRDLPVAVDVKAGAGVPAAQ